MFEHHTWILLQFHLIYISLLIIYLQIPVNFVNEPVFVMLKKLYWAFGFETGCGSNGSGS